MATPIPQAMLRQVDDSIPLPQDGVPMETPAIAQEGMPMEQPMEQAPMPQVSSPLAMDFSQAPQTKEEFDALPQWKKAVFRAARDGAQFDQDSLQKFVLQEMSRENEELRKQADPKYKAEVEKVSEEPKLDRAKIGQFLALEKQLQSVEELYKAGPNKTKGMRGALDYLPSDANARFNSAGAGLSEVGLAAFRVPGIGAQSDAELKQFVKANTPAASDFDAAIEQKMANLRTRLEATKQAWGLDPKAPAEQLLKQSDAPKAVVSEDDYKSLKTGQTFIYNGKTYTKQ